MRGGFFQRGGWWVLAQGALLLAVAGLGIADRNKSTHPALLLGVWSFSQLPLFAGSPVPWRWGEI